MKVIKVVVDELPEDCLLCSFLRHYTPHKNTDWEGCDELYCDLIGEEVAEDGRPDWCPLITQQELLRRVASPFNDWDDSEDK
jgi:hypothetical protein